MLNMNDFVKETHAMLDDINEAFISHGFASHISAHDATALWQKLHDTTKKMNEIKFKAQEKEWNE